MPTPPPNAPCQRAREEKRAEERDDTNPLDRVPEQLESGGAKPWWEEHPDRDGNPLDRFVGVGGYGDGPGGGPGDGSGMQREDDWGEDDDDHNPLDSDRCTPDGAGVSNPDELAYLSAWEREHLTAEQKRTTITQRRGYRTSGGALIRNPNYKPYDYPDNP